jgi:hypothetical protein
MTEFVRDDNALQLRRYLDELRLQLWWREGLFRVSRGVAAGALFALALSVWSHEPSGVPTSLAVMALFVAGSLLYCVTRRPSVLRAARQADRQNSLRNRLVTAAEILDGRIGGSLVSLQLADASRLSRSLSARTAFPQSTVQARNALLLGTGALIVFLGVLTITNPRSEEAVTPQVAESAAATEATRSPQELQQIRARSATEQAAITLLSDQLRKTAAARDVGQALQRGDIAAAAALLNQLAQDSDQLSQTAKQELAGALLNASKGTAALDKNLAEAELAATQAMTRSDYQASRRALQGLAAAVLSSQNGTLTQQQLVQQIQQLERDAARVGHGADCGVLTDDGEFFQDCSAVGQSPSSGAMGVVSRGSGQSQAGGVGEVAGGHGFATSGVDLDPLGQAPTRLDLPTADVPVDVPLSNAQGSGIRPNDKAPTLGISHSDQHDVQQFAGQQSSEPLAEQAERSVVSPAERTVVRDFFQPLDVQ